MAAVVEAVQAVPRRVAQSVEGNPEGGFDLVVGDQVRTVGGGVDEAGDQDRQGGAVKIVEAAEGVGGRQIEGQLLPGFPFGGPARECRAASGYRGW